MKTLKFFELHKHFIKKKKLNKADTSASNRMSSEDNKDKGKQP